VKHYCLSVNGNKEGVEKMSVVPAKKMHTSLSKEMVHVNNKKPKAKKEQPVVNVICAGRQEPSPEAFDKFMKTYLRIIQNIEERERLKALES
jgi:hypothetical protein